MSHYLRESPPIMHEGIPILIFLQHLLYRVFADWCNCLTLVSSACTPTIPPQPAKKKHIDVYNVQHKNWDARLLFFGRWWGHFKHTCRWEGSQMTASFGGPCINMDRLTYSSDVNNHFLLLVQFSGYFTWN